MKIEKDRILKKQLNTYLNNILTFTISFLKKYEKESHEDINKFLYSHPIYNNRDKINTFNNIIINLNETIKSKILDIQENSDIKQKRKNELNKINYFLSTNSLEDNNDIKLLAPSHLNNNNNNIIDSLENKELDILKEDTKDVNKKFLQKKKSHNNNKDNNIDKEIDNNKTKKEIFFTKCYICKEKLTCDNIHKFYGNLCLTCGNYNYSFREMKLDFSGRIAIVTGGRVKIGYYIAYKLLSYGCKVLVTSRFPKDTLLNYKKNPDYEIWKNNLTIYPIDFRIFESTVKFIKFIKENFTHIDILINNAAQTIRRTVEYYKYLLPIETKELNQEDDMKIIKTDYICLQKKLNEENKINDKQGISNYLIPMANNKESKEILPLSVIASQIRIMEEKDQPKVTLIGEDGQPYDFSQGKSSWSLEFDEIPFQEFTEVQIINLWTPYYLCVKLKPIMLKSPFKDKYIVNVTSPEGIFYEKNSSHVHTNMAKAALNMFTFTSARYLKKEGIYMTSVDTGWITHMKEMKNIMDEKSNKHYENVFVNVPLDELDGAMRVLHPIIEGIKNKNYLSGILLRNYSKSNW